MGREVHTRNNKENSYHPENLIFLEIPSQELKIKTKQVSHITVSNMEHAWPYVIFYTGVRRLLGYSQSKSIWFGNLENILIIG